VSCKSVFVCFLQDVNDHPPVFEVAMLNFSILENLPPNSVNFDFIASDLDIGENGELFFSLNGTNSDRCGAVHTRGTFTEIIREYSSIKTLFCLSCVGFQQVSLVLLKSWTPSY